MLPHTFASDEMTTDFQHLRQPSALPRRRPLRWSSICSQLFLRGSRRSLRCDFGCRGGNLTSSQPSSTAADRQFFCWSQTRVPPVSTASSRSWILIGVNAVKTTKRVQSFRHLQVFFGGGMVKNSFVGKRVMGFWVYLNIETQLMSVLWRPCDVLVLSANPPIEDPFERKLGECRVH